MPPVLSSAAALLDERFEHPAGWFSVVSYLRTIDALLSRNGFSGGAETGISI
jgi:hypothetical protein